MSLLVTDAIVLHGFDYMETSRIYRLLTREAGLQSVLARGARRPKSRFGGGGGALDLFSEGEAHVSLRPTRDLQTLTAFDATRARPGLAADLERFTAAAAIAELVLRFIQDERQPRCFDVVRATLDEIAEPHADPREAALAGAWRLMAELGFEPSVDVCIGCHSRVPIDVAAAFSHPAGGVLCDSCGGMHGHQRILPATARAALRSWLTGAESPTVSASDGRAHQRLLGEFLTEHLVEARPLRVFELWIGETWLRPLSCGDDVVARSAGKS
jgi:DNA repair protein RecO (recombination protein O)